MLIALVVVGHMLSGVMSDASGPVVMWIYSFHMPAFVLLCGYLSRSWTGTRKQAAGIVTGLVVPYVLLQAAHAAIAALRGFPFALHLLDPAWTLWFLPALVAWRLTTPLWRALRPSVALGAAVLVALLAPLVPDLGPRLALARVLSLLPFFVVGLLLTPEVVARLRDAGRGPSVAAAVVLVAGAVLALPTTRSVPLALFLYIGPYSDLPYPTLVALALRVLVLVAALVATVAVALLTPRRRTWLVRAGAASLSVYLLHGLVIMPFRSTTILRSLDTWWWVALLVVGGIALTWLLSTRPVVRAFEACVRPAWLSRALVGNVERTS
ncbi:acyltransferase family protein [Sanguibacter sp. HDW7]|nr:acyltransferase family protein [Sanguibacter sp. HDW7]